MYLPTCTGMPDADKAEIRRWLEWGRDNIRYLMVRHDLPDWPQQGKVDGSAHLLDDKGLIFLFNSDERENVGEFDLTEEGIDLDPIMKHDAYLVEQEYPLKNAKEVAKRFARGERVRWPVGRTAAVLRVKPAFTLVELLVVIGIIAMLFAMLLPSLRLARDAANRAVCMSNVRQIGTVALMYCQDHRGLMPSSVDAAMPGIQAIDFMNNASPDNWLRELCVPYLHGNINVLYCPVSVPSYDYPPTSISAMSYAANAVVFGRPVSHIHRASEVIMMMETNNRGSVAILRPDLTGGQYMYWHYTDPLNGNIENYCNTHDAGGNLLFCDGHAEYRKIKALRSRDFGLVPGNMDVSSNSFLVYDGEF